MLIKDIFSRQSSSRRLKVSGLKVAYKSLGFIDFGTVDQKKDEHDVVKGFMSSISHKDSHFGVGSVEDYNIRILVRSDRKNKYDDCVIIETKLHTLHSPHVAFVPTGRNNLGYERLLVSYPNLRPLNSMLGMKKMSPEFHGRYQVLARTSDFNEIEDIYISAIIAGIASKFWPAGIEVNRDCLYTYIASSDVTKDGVILALNSSLWLAKELDKYEAR